MDEKMARISFPILVLVLIGIGLLLLFTHSVNDIGKKRTLTSWLQQCWGYAANGNTGVAEAQNAILGIGAKKALPKLLRLVQSEE